MEPEIYSCPVCGKTGFEPFLHSKDHFLTGEKFDILQCKDCGFRMTSPVPDPNTIGKYYESKEYISHDTGDKNLMNLVYKTARFFTLRSKCRLVKTYSSGKKLLDIGCGTGEFLNFCHKKGFQCSGIEPGQKPRNFAVEHYHLPIKEKVAFSPEEKGTFDCITLWHVLEHIPDTNATLRLLKEALKPSGTLILALPNPDSFDACFYGEYWAAFDLPRHLFHFSSKNIKMLAEKNGFTLKKILPQYLDSFYIAMLSEKYKSGKKHPLKSFFRGFESNFKGNNPSFGFSSQIYILSSNFS